jgi:hypothetical protein
MYVAALFAEIRSACWTALHVLQVASLDMWSTIMFSAVDVVGPGHAPRRNANKYAALYFLSFLFIVCFFVQVGP